MNASLEGPAGSVDAEGDTYTSIERLRGGAGDDVLTGGTRPTRSTAPAATTRSSAARGIDTLVGGAGDRDRLSYQGDTNPIRADLRTPTVLAGLSDTTSGFEDVIGGNAAT